MFAAAVDAFGRLDVVFNNAGFNAPHHPLDEIATAAVFLASDDSSFITGVALPVDGGYVAE